MLQQLVFGWPDILLVGSDPLSRRHMPNGGHAAREIFDVTSSSACIPSSDQLSDLIGREGSEDPFPKGALNTLILLRSCEDPIPESGSRRSQNGCGSWIRSTTTLARKYLDHERTPKAPRRRK